MSGICLRESLADAAGNAAWQHQCVYIMMYALGCALTLPVFCLCGTQCLNQRTVCNNAPPFKLPLEVCARACFVLVQRVLWAENDIFCRNAAGSVCAH